MTPALARLGRAVREAIAANGGIDGAAATCGKSRSTAGNWNNRNVPDTPTLADALALDEVAIMQGATPPIASALAAELGCVIISLPDVEGTPHALTDALIEATAEFGDIARALCDARVDGVVDDVERRRIVAEIDSAQAALARMRVLAAGDPVVPIRTRGEQ